MGVDAQGRAGHQGEQVLALLNAQSLGLLGLNDLGAGDPVGEDLSEDLDDEAVTGLDLVQVGEHGGLGQTSVPGDDRAGPLSPDRQRGSLQVPQALEQGVVGRAVVDGQVQGDGGDLETGHEALVIGLEDVGVLQGAVLARAGTGGDVVVGLQDRPGRERVVVGVRLLDLGLGIGTSPIDLGGVVGSHLRLVVLGDPGGRRRIGQQPHAHHRHDGGDQGGDRQAPGAGAAVLLEARGASARSPGGAGCACFARDHGGLVRFQGRVDRVGMVRVRTWRCRRSTNRGPSSACTGAAQATTSRLGQVRNPITTWVRQCACGRGCRQGLAAPADSQCCQSARFAFCLRSR